MEVGDVGEEVVAYEDGEEDEVVDDAFDGVGEGEGCT